MLQRKQFLVIYTRRSTTIKVKSYLSSFCFSYARLIEFSSEFDEVLSSSQKKKKKKTSRIEQLVLILHFLPFGVRFSSVNLPFVFFRREHHARHKSVSWGIFFFLPCFSSNIKCWISAFADFIASFSFQSNLTSSETSHLTILILIFFYRDLLSFIQQGLFQLSYRSKPSSSDSLIENISHSLRRVQIKRLWRMGQPFN